MTTVEVHIREKHALAQRRSLSQLDSAAQCKAALCADNLVAKAVAKVSNWQSVVAEPFVCVWPPKALQHAPCQSANLTTALRTKVGEIWPTMALSLSRGSHRN